MPPVGPSKRTHISVQKKLELLRKLEAGRSVKSLCAEFGVSKQCVSDIKKSKAALEKYSSDYCVDVTSAKGKSGGPRKHMKTGKSSDLDAAVIKWYTQQRALGVNVRGVELISAAERLAKHFKNNEFKGSDGWLWRFRRRYGLFNSVIRGEAGDADVAAVEPFRLKLRDLIAKEGLVNAQLYNADETGLYWRSMPKNSQVRSGEEQTRGKKASKERLSALVGANADGTHRLKLVIVGKSRAPRAIKDIMQDLPVIYFNSKKAWFNCAIFLEWFNKFFVPAVIKFQTEVLKLKPEDIKAVLLLDNAPAHPAAEQLVSLCGRIKVLYLPPNTTSVVQPMDQGVISALKRRYIKKYLDEVLAVTPPPDGQEDNRGAQTLANIKAYNIRSAIFNMAYSWSDIKISTLANSWKKLLMDEEVEADFVGFEAEDLQRQLQTAGEVGPSVDDVRDWLDEQESDPGFQVLGESEIAEAIINPEEHHSSSDEEDVPIRKHKLATVRQSVEILLDYTTYNTRPECQSHYSNLRMLREKIIREQYEGGKQMKITGFFKPTPGTSGTQEPPATPHEPTPGTSGTQDPPATPHEPTTTTSGTQDPPASPVAFATPVPPTRPLGTPLPDFMRFGAQFDEDPDDPGPVQEASQ